LYTDDAEVAWKHVKGQWEALKGSLLLRTQVLRIDAFYLQARTALAVAAHTKVTSDKRKRLLKTVERMARRIEKERMPWSDPLVSLIRAGVAYNRREDLRAATLLSESIEGFDLADMGLRANAARRRLGQLLGGDRGSDLVAQADAWMSNQGIKNPALMTRMLAPGWEAMR